MLEFHIKKATRLCYKTGERLTPGAAFYSVLVTEENEVVRHDYSLAAWEGAPEDALAWWKSEMPYEEGSKVNLAPDEVVLQYCLLYTSPSPRDKRQSRMPSSA